MFCVYAIHNKIKDKIYIGQSRDFEKRLQRHNGELNTKITSYTYKNKGNWELIHKEEFKTRNEAIIREKELKSYQGRLFIRMLIKKI